MVATILKSDYMYERILDTNVREKHTRKIHVCLPAFCAGFTVVATRPAAVTNSHE